MKIENPTIAFLNTHKSVFKGKIIFSNDLKLDNETKVAIGKHSCFNTIYLLIKFYFVSKKNEYTRIKIDNESIKFGSTETIKTFTNEICNIFILKKNYEDVFTKKEDGTFVFILSLYHGPKCLDSTDVIKVPPCFDSDHISEYISETMKKGIIWSADDGEEKELKNAECLLRLSHAPKAKEHVVLCFQIKNILYKSYLTPKSIITFGIETFIYYFPFVKNILIAGENQVSLKWDILNPYFITLDFNFSQQLIPKDINKIDIVELINEYCRLLKFEIDTWKEPFNYDSESCAKQNFINLN